MAETPSREDVSAVAGGESRWRRAFSWFADALFLPCKPFFSFPHSNSPAFASTATSPSAVAAHVAGTFFCRPHESDHRVTLCLQQAPDAGPVIIDLPIGARELNGAGRIALECDRLRWAGPLLEAPRWAVRCGGRRAGFGGPRPATGAEARALEALKAVTSGAGRLPPPPPPSGRRGESFAYVRGNFERVVGSADSESYHLVDPTGSLGLQLSLFFLRV
ncbi:protein MIZU-KUSSEI 1-like [Curcuma longa]|uniref:protein MIZU-KUSSEI 1-like n=1 Tax=Curcuma longa TaxID=136217 RepID=UPI003D9E4B0C